MGKCKSRRARKMATGGNINYSNKYGGNVTSNSGSTGGNVAKVSDGSAGAVEGFSAPTVSAASMGAATMDPTALSREGINQADFLAAYNAQNANQADARNQQLKLVQALQARANGDKPSLAQMQLQQTLNQNLQNQQGAVAGQKGINPALAARMINANASNMAQQANAQGAMLKATEQQAVESALGGMLSNLRGQDLNAMQAASANNANQNALNADMNKAQATLDYQTKYNNANWRQDANKTNAQLSQQAAVNNANAKYDALKLEAQRKQQLWSNVFSAASGIVNPLGNLAKGLFGGGGGTTSGAGGGFETAPVPMDDSGGGFSAPTEMAMAEGGEVPKNGVPYDYSTRGLDPTINFTGNPAGLSFMSGRGDTDAADMFFRAIAGSGLSGFSTGMKAGIMADNVYTAALGYANGGEIPGGVQQAPTFLDELNKSSSDWFDASWQYLQSQPMSDGGIVPGKAQVKGDSERNDTVPAVVEGTNQPILLSPGEVVLPRSVVADPETAPDKAAQFVAELKRVKDRPKSYGQLMTKLNAIKEQLTLVESKLGGKK